MKKSLLSVSLLGVMAGACAQDLDSTPKSVGDMVANIKKNDKQDLVAKIIKKTKVVDLSLQHITSLEGIAEFPGIEHALVLRVPINSIKTVKAGTFKSPKFKNLLVLDLGQNLLEDLEPGALEGLDGLRMLLLNDNNLTRMPSGVLPKKVKIISIGNNPRPSFARKMSSAGEAEAYRQKAAADLAAQVKEQAPRAVVYAGPITRQFIQRAITLIGTVAATAGVIWLAFFWTPSSTPVLTEAEKAVVLIEEQAKAAHRLAQHDAQNALWVEAQNHGLDALDFWTEAQKKWRELAQFVKADKAGIEAKKVEAFIDEMRDRQQATSKKASAVTGKDIELQEITTSSE